MKEDKLRTWVSYRKLWGPRITEIDYDISLADMIKACGFAKVDERISEEMFPRTKSGRKNVEIMFFKFWRALRWWKGISTKTVLKRMKNKDLGDVVPIGIEELLVISKHFPELQLKAPIVAIGSPIKCDFIGHEGAGTAVPCIFECDKQRVLGLTSFGHSLSSHIWPLEYRFPAIGKVINIVEPQEPQADEEPK